MAEEDGDEFRFEFDPGVPFHFELPVVPVVPTPAAVPVVVQEPRLISLEECLAASSAKISIPHPVGLAEPDYDALDDQRERYNFHFDFSGGGGGDAEAVGASTDHQTQPSVYNLSFDFGAVEGPKYDVDYAEEMAQMANELGQDTTSYTGFAKIKRTDRSPLDYRWKHGPSGAFLYFDEEREVLLRDFIVAIGEHAKTQIHNIPKAQTISESVRSVDGFTLVELEYMVPAVSLDNMRGLVWRIPQLLASDTSPLYLDRFCTLWWISQEMCALHGSVLLDRLDVTPSQDRVFFDWSRGFVQFQQLMLFLIQRHSLNDSSTNEARRYMLERFLSSSKVLGMVQKWCPFPPTVAVWDDHVNQQRLYAALDEIAAREEPDACDRTDIGPERWHTLRAFIWLRRLGFPIFRFQAMFPPLILFLSNQTTIATQALAVKILAAKPGSILGQLPRDVLHSEILGKWLWAPPFDMGLWLPGLSSVEVALFVATTAKMMKTL